MEDNVIKAAFSRAVNIVTKPGEAIPAFKSEQVAKNDLIKYVAVLAILPFIGSLIGLSVVGMNVGFIPFKMPFEAALSVSILNYIVAIIGFLILGWVINMLAPKFGSTQDQNNAAKLAACTVTPGLLAGILNIIPTLSIIVAIAGLYGLYLLYKGLPVFMETPDDKTIVYALVVIVVYFIIIAVIGVLVGLITASMYAPLAYY